MSVDYNAWDYDRTLRPGDMVMMIDSIGQSWQLKDRYLGQLGIFLRYIHSTSGAKPLVRVTFDKPVSLDVRSVRLVTRAGDDGGLR